MPTARELLEQADRLMRRNRSRPADTDIPELTDVVPASALSPAAVLDDVPELTDVVAEFEVRSVLGGPRERDAPSVWRSVDRGHPVGLDLAPNAIAAIALSVRPSAPDEAPVLPPVAGEIALEAAPPPAAAEASVEVEAPPAAAEVPVEAAPPPAVAEAPVEAAPSPAVAEASVEAEPPPAVAEVPVEAAPPPAVAEAPVEAAPSPAAAEVPVETALLPPAAAEVPVEARPLPPAAGHVPVEAAPPRAATEARAEATPLPPAAEAEVPVEAAALPGATASDALADDPVHQQALAEELRTQVLQRIDVFTDALVRERLGVHLQPIVDRASADLVAAVNEQVRKLLRDYVSEAIEREIEKWRQTRN